MFFLPRSCPAPSVTQSMSLVSLLFPFCFLMSVHRQSRQIMSFLRDPVKIPIGLSSALRTRRPAGDTKARGQCMQFSARWEGDGNGKGGDLRRSFLSPGCATQLRIYRTILANGPCSCSSDKVPMVRGIYEKIEDKNSRSGGVGRCDVVYTA